MEASSHVHSKGPLLASSKEKSVHQSVENNVSFKHSCPIRIQTAFILYIRQDYIGRLPKWSYAAQACTSCLHSKDRRHNYREHAHTHWHPVGDCENHATRLLHGMLHHRLLHGQLHRLLHRLHGLLQGHHHLLVLRCCCLQ